MSARPHTPPLPPFQQAALAKALPSGRPAGTLLNTVLNVDGRVLAVAAGKPIRQGDWDAELTRVVERRASARVDRLLPVVATGCHDGWHWVAYEAGRTPSLAAEGWRRWPASLALSLLSEVASAVDDAAAFGVVPYELSPASIFIDPRVGALLGDLGAPREVFGTVLVDEHGDPFTPPEVVEGNTAGARSGVYVCGALLYALLAGGPPRAEPLTRWRADLPQDIDLVVSRAMARDTLERYRTANDFVDAVYCALDLERPAEAERATREPPAPVAVASDAPRPERRPGVAYPPERPPVLPPPVETEPDEYEWRPPAPRWLRPLVVALGLAGAVVAGLAGWNAGRPDPPPPEAGPELVAAGLRLTLPAGWIPGAPSGQVLLAAYPGSDWFSGLEVRLQAGAPAGEAGEDPVRIGSLDMWRHTSGTPQSVSYTLPTTRGAVSISCEGTPPILAKCERAVSTLRLDSGRALPLAGVAQKPGLRAALARYARERARGRAALARAAKPGAQRAAALSLVRAGRDAARRLSRFDGTDDLARAVAGTASAYRALADAASSGRRARWREDVARVRRTESAVAAELRRQG